MKNSEPNITKFQPYINKVIKKYQKLSFVEKTQGLWSNPEIVEYFGRIGLDGPNKYLSLSLKEIVPDLDNKKILCIGGGIGKLGRHIATIYPKVHVTEIDLSREMVSQANKLAFESNLKERFISIERDVRSLSFKNGEYDYAVAYGVFRYMSFSDQKKALSEISRVTNHNFTVAESILRKLIYDLGKIIRKNYFIKETEMSMFRVSLFCTLFKEYYENEDFRKMVDSENKRDKIETLISVAGMTLGTLYELRSYNI